MLKNLYLLLLLSLLISFNTVSAQTPAEPEVAVVESDEVVLTDIIESDSILTLEGDSFALADTIVYRHSEIFVELFGDSIENAFSYIDTLDYSQLPPLPQNSYRYMVIVYDDQHIIPVSLADVNEKQKAYESRPLNYNDKWLCDLVDSRYRADMYINRFVIEHPEQIRYNVKNLPEAPKEYVIKSDPNSAILTLEEIKVSNANVGVAKEQVKVKTWLSDFTANIQFSQAYVSANWYQGGNSNLNLLGNFVYNIRLNPNKYPKLLFENRFQYKIGIYSTPDDSLRNYNLSEDMLQINSKFGVKAVNHWYYTADLQFKTQFFNNYQSNTHTMKAAFLSPGELNIGVGMTYSTVTNKKRMNINMSINPISYNLKICRDITNLNPESFGIDAGKHTANQVGSNMEFKCSWLVSANISWNSRLYAFSDYKYVQMDWQHTFNFTINKYLSSQIFLNLRYDSSSIPDSDWKRWQFKEILSFGFTYKI